MKQQQTQPLIDVPAETFEKYLQATGETFAGLGASPTQADIQARLAAAAEKIGIKGPHASVLALRYSLFVTIMTQHQTALARRGLVAGDAGQGKSTRFQPSFLAACARLPCRFGPATGFVYDPAMLWKLIDAVEAAAKASAAPQP